MADYYKQLESTIPTYKNLAGVSVKENGEDFAALDRKEILFGYMPKSDDMKKVLNNKIIVRKTVYKLLKKAQKDLESKNPYLRLFVTYGYRDLSIQIKRFNEVRKSLLVEKDSKVITDEDVHRFVAVPDVAGHPTGGAVDVVIQDVRDSSFLDFGSTQYDYSTKKCYVFEKNIDAKQKENRMLLRKVMTESGFAPFDGEWWHFSYGDREWAFYYDKEFAIYDQMRYKDIPIK